METNTRQRVEVKDSKRHLRCELTGPELLTAGRELADRSVELSALENEKARVSSDFSARIKGKQADIQILTNRIQTRCEYREVQCAEHLHQPQPGKKTIVRTDTGETIGVETMTTNEMQPELIDRGVAA